MPWDLGLVVAVAVLATVLLIGILAPAILYLTGLPSPNVIDTSGLSAQFGTPTGPSATHWFGVDETGRDILSRVTYGTRVSLGVAVAATVISLVVGVTIGMVAGFTGGWTDTLVSRGIEVFLVVPYLLLAVGIAASCSGADGCFGGALQPGVPLLILIIAMTSWPGVARLTRNQTAAIRSAEYISAARVAGLSTPRIMATEVLPNLGGSILVYATVLLPQAILAEAALSFVGVGVPASTSSWGQMIVQAAPSFPDTWWTMFFPGVLLLATVTSIAVIGGRLQGLDGSVAGWGR